MSSIEKYTNIKQIGEGTYGKVYKVTDPETNKILAVKKIEIDKDDGFPFTTIREIKILKKLKSPHIVELFNQFIDKDDIYLEMEFLPYDLTALIQTGYIFSDDHIKSLAYQLIEATRYMHSFGIVHRDIKTSNVLINNDGTLKLADFGLSRKYNDLMTNRVCTLWYRSPELLLGSNKYDYRIDSWSIGCIILEMKMGITPFKGKDEIDQVKIIFKTLGPPTEKYKWCDLFNVDKYIRNEEFNITLKKRYGEYYDDEMLCLIGKFLMLDQEKRILPIDALLLNTLKEYKNKKFRIDEKETHDFYIKERKKRPPSSIFD